MEDVGEPVFQPFLGFADQVICVFVWVNPLSKLLEKFLSKFLKQSSVILYTKMAIEFLQPCGLAGQSEQTVSWS